MPAWRIPHHAPHASLRVDVSPDASSNEPHAWSGNVELTHSFERRAAQPSAAARTMRGTVELFARREITGVVYTRHDAAPIGVNLMLNDLEIAKTWAADPIDPERPERGRAFRFALSDMWRYAGPDDAISVRVEGRALPIALRACACAVTPAA